MRRFEEGEIKALSLRRRREASVEEPLGGSLRVVAMNPEEESRRLSATPGASISIPAADAASEGGGAAGRNAERPGSSAQESFGLLSTRTSLFTEERPDSEAESEREAQSVEVAAAGGGAGVQTAAASMALSRRSSRAFERLLKNSRLNVANGERQSLGGRAKAGDSGRDGGC